MSVLTELLPAVAAIVCGVYTLYTGLVGVPRLRRERARLVIALQHTVEYVGLATLQPCAGWSWYDAWNSVDPEGLRAWLATMPSPSMSRW